MPTTLYGVYTASGCEPSCAGCPGGYTLNLVFTLVSTDTTTVLCPDGSESQCTTWTYASDVFTFCPPHCDGVPDTTDYQWSICFGCNPFDQTQPLVMWAQQRGGSIGGCTITWSSVSLNPISLVAITGVGPTVGLNGPPDFAAECFDCYHSCTLNFTVTE